MITHLFEKRIANRTRVGFIFAFILLLAGNVFLFTSTQKVRDQSRSIAHMNFVVEGLNDVMFSATRAESVFFEYLLQQNDEKISVWRSQRSETYSSIPALRRLTAGNEEQSRRIQQIEADLEQTFQLQEKVLDLPAHELQSRQLTPAITQLHRLMQNLESHINETQLEEERMLREKSEKISEYASTIKLISVVSTMIAILLTLYSIVVYNKENKAKKEADQQADGYRQQLQNQVDQLAEMNRELIELRNIEKFASTGRVARTIAHEVRNPLTNINLAVEQLKTEFEGTENADTFLDMIARNAVRINNLVSDLLNATKLTELSKKPVAIGDLISECLDEAADRIKLNQIHVIRNYHDADCKVLVDKEKIKIALLNLIVNGIEAMEAGGTLTITTRKEKGKCEIEISDTGPGMTSEQMNRLFEPFFTTKKMGNGLGLANAQNIILSHNGSIKCVSEEGKGTSFFITIDFA